MLTDKQKEQILDPKNKKIFVPLELERDVAVFVRAQLRGAERTISWYRVTGKDIFVSNLFNEIITLT